MSKSLFLASRTGTDNNGSWGPVGRLDALEVGYRFVYTKGAKTLNGFYPLPGMPDFNEVYESDEIFPLFQNRLLSKSRPEYKQFLSWIDLDSNSPPDPIAYLGITQGKKVTDQLEMFPNPSRDQNGNYLVKFFVHGIRWQKQSHERIAQLQPNERLFIMSDFQNKHDKNAFAIRTEETQEIKIVGFAPKYFAPDIKKLMNLSQENDLHLSVVKVNQDAPLQQRLLCELKAKWLEGFEPYQGEEFKPIVENI